MLNASIFKQSIVTILALSLVIGAIFGVNQAQALTDIDDVDSGSLIRGESFAAVYYMGVDGFRYVFPNSSTYFTWYDDFDSVVWISDSDLATIPIGGNVTYRAGERMVKITSDPTTYAVDVGGVLRHVGSEDIAVDLYGSSWNTMIDDVPDSFFSNYSIGDPIEDSSDYDAADASAEADSINEDKGLVAPEVIEIDSDGYDPIDVTIEAGQAVKFVNNDSDVHSATGDDLSWGTGTIQPGSSSIERFDEEGTYTFFDSYDSSNTGAVYVE